MNPDRQTSDEQQIRALIDIWRDANLMTTV
jgi:hypothetical protein